MIRNVPAFLVSRYTLLARLTKEMAKSGKQLGLSEEQITDFKLLNKEYKSRLNTVLAARKLNETLPKDSI